ncbi:PDZ domain-containing protein [Gemmata sp. JC717]|uniref:S41 family peptidase n=1 Tax=Gemmata algarum TaxID=2975278 RepID=UPI0021BAAB26|nr:S41 family peptidase [Gemmata algarum]MDY3551185.1 PDZ domain-containing protein [Gemmata algarum]
MRYALRLGLLTLALAGHAPAALAQPDQSDTRLLAMPAISAKNIAFVYADDLWVADAGGKNPRRLTTDLGLEAYPVFSPDGQTIAFSAQYDGNVDVYTIPITGGAPTRLTSHPSPDTVRGFTPDGKSVLFSSPRHVYSNRYAQLFTVPLTGGMPTQLPIPWGFEAAYSPDGDHIAYTPVRDATPQWKNYRGGTHSRVWIYDVKTHDVVEIPQPKDRCNDLDPNWIGKKLYFRSDRAGDYNVFCYDTDNKDVTAVTKFTDFPVLDINTDGKTLIFEQAGYLHTLTPPESASTRLKVGIAIDNSESRPRFAKGSKYVRDVSVSPSGSRVAVEFRGEIVTVPAEKGDARVLTNTPDVHERNPAWSPDGKTIAYFSDAGGEYQLVLAPQNGKGEPKKVKLSGNGFYFDPVWSRDSKKLLFRDNAQTVFYVEVESGKITKVVEPKHGLGRGLKPSSWSPDSKWVVYSINTPAQISRVYAYSLEKGTSTPITDGLTEATDPAFDAGGKYVYFLGSSDTGMSKHGFSQSAADSRQPRWSINLVVLNKDLPSPFLRESDEEKGESDRPTPKSEKKDSPAFSIDFAGIDQRILSFPLPPGSYAGLSAGTAGQVYYITRSEAGEGGRGPGGGGVLSRYDLDRKRASVVQAGVVGYELTPDGRKLLYTTGGGNWFITAAGGGSGGGAPTGAIGGRPGGLPTAPAPSPAGGAGGDGKVNFETVEVRVDPRAEWKQIYEEAWRINRDFFYDPNMHGADWPAMKKKYEVFLPHLTSSADLYRVIRWLLSELAVGHSYITSYGERPFERKTVPGGLLGADYEIAEGRYKFKKIYGGLNWSAAMRSPLTAPGVNVKEGEFLLAVNGKELKAPTEIYSLFENTAGKLTELTVGPNADGTKSRTVTVEPIANDYNLRNMDWVEGNLKKVEQATGGRVGYVHVRDTAAGGMADFKRYFFPQVDKEALIIDERFNSGGQIADYYIDILRRPFASYWAPRHGADNRSPSAAVFGPKVMIIDEGAGSGGDMLPYMFRKFGVGPLVGKRTWGGLVGIGGYPVLMDGGTVTAPSFAIWDPEKGFIVENEGVAPDYDVTMWPKDLIAGKDPQLEKAIELALEALKKNPPKKDVRPEYPKRALPAVQP